MDDLHEVGFDVVGIGRFPKDETSEALGIMRAVDFLAHARDLLMVAACAAATRMACSPAKRSQDAERFMQSVRLAKMEGYGFAVRLLAPVTPVWKSTDSSAELYAHYERSVVPILQESLEALCLAAQKDIDGDAGHLGSLLPCGASHICDALMGLHKALDSQWLEIEISYSANRKEPRSCARIRVEDYIPRALKTYLD